MHRLSVGNSVFPENTSGWTTAGLPRCNGCDGRRSKEDPGPATLSSERT